MKIIEKRFECNLNLLLLQIILFLLSEFLASRFERNFILRWFNVEAQNSSANKNISFKLAFLYYGTLILRWFVQVKQRVIDWRNMHWVRTNHPTTSSRVSRKAFPYTHFIGQLQTLRIITVLVVVDIVSLRTAERIQHNQFLVSNWIPC